MNQPLRLVPPRNPDYFGPGRIREYRWPVSVGEVIILVPDGMDDEELAEFAKFIDLIKQQITRPH